MEQEELGSRPKSRIIIGKQGITASEIRGAFEAADLVMDNQGLRRYSKSVVIAPKDTPRTANNAIELDVQDLHSALAGMDKEMSINLGMFLIALALNIPPRWLWPATSVGATKADAMYSHVAGMGGGIGHLLMIMKSLLGGDDLSEVLGKPIGPQFNVVFDYQDDEQDAAKANINKVRADTRKINLETKVTDISIEREQMVEDGELTRQQFERRGATGQQEADKLRGMMDREFGKAEYVFNAWRMTGNYEALKQLRTFCKNMLEFANSYGESGGMLKENARYMAEYDRIIQASGGVRTLEALGAK